MKSIAGRRAGTGKTRNYTFDPATPVESIGGEALLHTMPQIGSHLQPEPDYREDVLSFVSEPLEETFTLNGKASVRLFVESDCEDTAFTAKIMEVTPEGKAYNIRSSIATLEQGKRRLEPMNRAAWQRYRLLCGILYTRFQRVPAFV